MEHPDDEYGFCPNCKHENIHTSQIGEVGGKVCCFYCHENELAALQNNFYCLVALPYPSADSLHIGHCYNYAVVDSYCRWLTYKGTKVFQPFGYDAHGLSVELYAKKVGRDPYEVAAENISRFRVQMDTMNTNFQEKLSTTDPSYIKWTQWIFTQLYNRGLAYKRQGDANWCESCGTVLANEQVKDKRCDRCGTEIVIKPVDQWYFKITDYKDRLVKNLDTLSYPESTIKQQRNWLENLHDWSIGRQRKFGCPIPIEGETQTMDTFVDSSFYFIRYCDPTNEDELCAKDRYRPVDLYVIGPEHACSHLIYARFIHMFLFDIGVVPVEEPFRRVLHQGMITMNGERMSKSKGNVVNPDAYPSGLLRMYLMFIGHYFDGGAWDDTNMVGIERFFGKMDRWFARVPVEGDEDIDLAPLEKQIDGYVMSFKFNKVISSFMEFYNKNKNRKLSHNTITKLKDILHCFAPTKY